MVLTFGQQRQEHKADKRRRERAPKVVANPEPVTQHGLAPAPVVLGPLTGQPHTPAHERVFDEQAAELQVARQDGESTIPAPAGEQPSLPSVPEMVGQQRQGAGRQQGQD
jgi:hypothetical protein